MTDRVARYPWWPEKRCRRWRQGWFTGTWRIYGEQEKSLLPAAKPSGPRVVRVVVVLVVGGSSLSEHKLTFYSFDFASAS